MHFISVLLLVISISCLATGSRVFCKGLGYFENHHGLIFNWPLPKCPEALHLKIALFTRNHRNSPRYMTIGQVPVTLQRGVRTMFLIHGYAGSHQSWQDLMRTQLLIKGDFNVIEIYWNSLKLYQQSASDIRTVGAAVGEMARHLANEHGISDLWCIGHSLGAHACGLAGKRYNGGFKRITGLDPAGPMFRWNRGVGLQRSDALYVDAIHTDGSLFGEMFTVGQTDFFVNGGKSQPGCC